jgi:asparagine synthase (glutamine-hydrolysing)
MPGIVGIIGKDALKENEHALHLMVNSMMHETSYSSGNYINKQLGLYIGWVSHKGSFCDCMPVWNETKDVCLIFSGEDFTKQSDLENLRARGHHFDSENASYLVHLYEEIGLNFIEKINGWFSGVVVDLRRQIAILFNDRYGLGRIYYHFDNDKFYFASEAKSLLKTLPHLRHIDFKSLGETFNFGCALQNRTLFSYVSLLPGGSMWTISGQHEVRKDRYFNIEDWENQPVLSETNFYDKLKEIFPEILERYFVGKQNIGISLTGGLDGRMIMAWANRPKGSLPCYTFGGAYRDCIDVKLARRIANMCQQTHETITVGTDFLDQFPSLAEKAVYVSDGTMDVTGSVEIYVNRLARQIAPIRLTGNYGSEIIRGGVAFGPRSVTNEFLDSEFSLEVENARNTYSSERQGHPLSFIAFKQVPWHHYSRLSVERSQLTVRSPYLDNDLLALLYQAPTNLLMSKDPSFRLIADGNPVLTRIPTDRGLLYRPLPLISIFHHLYQEFTFKSEYAYDYGMPQWLTKLDHLLKPMHIERLFLGRHKFYHFRIWYRDRLFSYLKETLLDPRSLSRPYLDGKKLENMIINHISGQKNYTREIHRLLTTELTHRLFIDKE